MLFKIKCFHISVNLLQRKVITLNLGDQYGSSHAIKIPINVVHSTYKLLLKCLQDCNSENPCTQHCKHSSSLIL